MTTFFLHGLDSSGRGTKGKYFARHFPEVACPDFSGGLEERLDQFAAVCDGHDRLTLIGSSFGGLMATCFAIRRPERVQRLILLAPALNFAGYAVPEKKIETPTLVVIGRHDTVTPPEQVLPMARRTFAVLEEILADDDHMLHSTFQALNWRELLAAR